MAAKRQLWRAKNGSGAGYILNPNDETYDELVKQIKDDYAVESEEEMQAKQAAADEASADINAAGSKKSK